MSLSCKKFCIALLVYYVALSERNTFTFFSNYISTIS
jgi:hypothetical protein